MSPQQEGPVRFGDYYLIDKLAVGGMAEIWRGKTVGLEGFERTVALKLILPSYTQNAEFNSMFVDEARIASSLNHSNIARITNFGVTDGRYYHEEEFIDGRSVRQMLQKCHDSEKLLPIDSACYIVSEVSKGLHYAHTKHDPVTNEPLNVIHRDMSPQNIMVSFEGEVKIIDWGIAKAKGKMEETRAGVLKGKFGYMSPEQAEGEELDSRSDIFSLGIVFYESVTGERLFVADNEINTLKKIREGHVPAPSKVNPLIDKELETILLKMLARPRIERYQSCYDVHEDILKYLHKKFPAYNSLKLSKFIKELFSSEILADRKRISEKEQSVPSYSTLSYGSRSSEDKTRISVSERSSYEQFANETSASDDKDKTVLVADQSSNNVYSEPATETVADAQSRGSYAPRPKRSEARPLHFRGNKKRSLVRLGLAAMFVILLGLAFLMPTVKTPSVVKEEIIQEEVVQNKGLQKEELTKEETPTEDISNTPQETAKKVVDKIKDSIQNIQQNIETQKRKAEVDSMIKKEDYNGRLGNLTLSTEPINADVIIDGHLKGRTPLTLKDLTLGKRYELVLKAPGFNTVNKIFTLRRESNNLVLPLTPDQDQGRTYISISIEPPAQVYLDGELIGNFKSSIYMHQVEPGNHNLRFVNKKLDIDYSTSIKVEKGEHLKKDIMLR